MNLYKSIMAVLLALHVYSVQSQSVDKGTIALEIDPVTFGFKGYSLHLRFTPRNNHHLLYGIGTYAMNMPDAIVNFNPENKNSGWNVRINQGYSLFGEHHFDEVNRKWFVGGQVGIQQFRIEKDNLNGQSTFTNLLTMGYVGYTLRPFEHGLYIKPWAGIGYTTKLSGTNVIENATYDIAPITIFLTFHVGYQF